MRVRFFTFLSILAALIFCATRASAAGNVRVSMRDGRVTVSATNATLRDILDAWARAGQTAFVNLDGVANADPITLELADVREEEALAVLLRTLGGYLTVRRASPRADISRFDRVVLLPASVSNLPASVSNQNSTVINTPTAAVFPSVSPAGSATRPDAQQTVMVNGVTRLVAPNGTIVEDDQQGAPPPPAPRGFSRGDAPGPVPPQARPPAPPAPAAVPPVTGSAAPGVIAAPPHTSTPAPPIQR
jgi:hypothetical protein